MSKFRFIQSIPEMKNADEMKMLIQTEIAYQLKRIADELAKNNNARPI